MLRGKFDDTTMNTVGSGEHVGDVERLVRTVKEKTRGHIHILVSHKNGAWNHPFLLLLPSRQLGLYVKDLNIEIPNDGVSEDIRPGPLIPSKSLVTKK